MIQPADFRAVANEARQGYMNRILTTVNDHDVHISVMDVPFFRHMHPESDETFIMVEGVLIIDFDDGPVELHAGQMLTVPAGRRHRTRPAGARSVNLTVEKAGATTVRCEAPSLPR
jgi:mannose-6-phosphate isomerase-like protein (cupin superfamily)